MYSIFESKYKTKCRFGFLIFIVALGQLAKTSVARKEDHHLMTPKLNNYRQLVKSSRGRSSRDRVKFIVKYKDHASMISSMSKSYSSVVTVENEMPQYFVSTLISNEETMEEIKNQDEVIIVEEDELLYSVGFVVEEIESGNSHRQLVEQKQYGIRMTEADQISSGSTKIGICVVDTGYGLGHEDLPTSSDGVRGWDIRGNGGSWNVDKNSHGTHCAGTIGAIGRNNIGIYGVNDDPSKFNFFIGKGLSDNGTGSTSAVMEAISKCVENGAKVVNLSLGGRGRSRILEDFYKSLYDDNILLVAAAGNFGNSDSFYPASYPYVMSVGAVDRQGRRSSFSVANDQTEISAPGAGIWSTITTNNGRAFTYASYSGTSMACPYVAGVAAKLWSHFPDCTNNQIRNVLLETAGRRMGVCDNSYGFGIVKAKAAYDRLRRNGCAAGGDRHQPLSKGALGGCAQTGKGLTPPPTPEPPSRSFSCMSGDTGIPTIERIANNDERTSSKYQKPAGFYEVKHSVTNLKNLKVGDTVEGLDKNQNKTYCNVEAIGMFGRGTLYGNYTEDHFIFNPTAGNIVMHGSNGPKTVEDKYELLTSCPLGIDESGTAFTPLDSDFCGIDETEMSWSDYLAIHAAIVRVVRESGPYWFDGNSYKDDQSLKSFSPHICKAMLKCLKESKNDACEELEVISKIFVEDYLTSDATEATRQAFPQMGHVGVKGSVSYVVSDSRAFHQTAAGISVITGGSFLLVSLIIGSIILIVRTRGRRKLFPKNSISEITPEGTLA